MQVARRGVDRVGIEHDQRLDLAGLHVTRQRGERGIRVRRPIDQRFGIAHRRAGAAERSVDAMDERLELGPMVRADRHQRG